MQSFRDAAAVLLLTTIASPVCAMTWTGYSTMLTGTTSSARPELAGQVIATQDIPFSSPSYDFDLTVRNYVVRENGAGTLDFYYQFIGSAATTQQVFQMEATGYEFIADPAQLDVDQLTDGDGNYYYPFIAGRPDNTSGPGAWQGSFFFGSGARGTGVFPLDPGQVTIPFFVKTTATAFDTHGTLGFPSISGTIPGMFAPVSEAPVPEPASLCLLCLGVAGLGLRVRRR